MNNLLLHSHLLNYICTLKKINNSLIYDIIITNKLLIQS